MLRAVYDKMMIGNVVNSAIVCGVIVVAEEFGLTGGFLLQKSSAIIVGFAVSNTNKDRIRRGGRVVECT